MSFLNKKEETFDLVLTEKGREKLSKGEFIPFSYAFYDSDVIYDNSYGNSPEAQNDASPRIKKALHRGEQVTWDDTTKQKTDSKSLLKYPRFFEIGNYEYIQKNKPAWEIYVKEGEITGSIKQFPIELEKAGVVTSLDDYRHDKIPQLNVFCEYVLYKTMDEGVEKIFVERSSDDMQFKVLEQNSFDDNENFILEVFQFAAGYSKIKKLIFVNEDDPITADNVEHFFNILTDDAEAISINFSVNLEKIEEPFKDLEDEC